MKSVYRDRLILLSFSISVIHVAAEQRNATRHDLHTSPVHIEALYTLDEIVGDTLKLIPSPDERIESYMESYEWLVDDIRNSREDFRRATINGHTLHIYTLIKRLVVFYPSIRSIFNSVTNLEANKCEDHLTECGHLKFQNYCEKHLVFMMSHCPKTCGLCLLLDGIRAAKEAEKAIQLPSAGDLKGIVAGVARLQKLYSLPIDLMTSGTIHDFHTSVELSTWDCLQIGQYFIEEKIFSNAWLWFSHIFSTSTNLDVKEYATRQLGFIKNSHDATWQHDESHFQSLLSESPDQTVLRSQFSLSCTKASSVQRHPIFTSELADFSCKLSTRGNPFLILQPIKQETVSKDPEITLFHDVISDSEIGTLKRLARNNLSRDVKPNRRSEQALLSRSNAVVEAIERRASMLSGLKMPDPTETDPEPLKIRSYGACGDLQTHTDTKYKHNANDSEAKFFPSGDRIATVLFYLNDVLDGGATTFISLGLEIIPKKGSAVMFYNLLKSGTYDQRMLHGSCPLTVGDKWVAVKWFREKYNFLLRPCSTNPKE